MDDVKLIPCPGCGGQPVVLIQPGWPHPRLHVECSVCRREGATVYYAPVGDVFILGADSYLLPGLEQARREAAGAWNAGSCA